MVLTLSKQSRQIHNTDHSHAVQSTSNNVPFFLQQFSVFFGQKMPLKLRWTLMSNWINVEDDIDHDEDEEAPR